MEAGRIGEGKIKTFSKKERQGGARWRLPLVGDGHWGQIEKERCWHARPSHGSRDGYGAVRIALCDGK